MEADFQALYREILYFKKWKKMEEQEEGENRKKRRRNRGRWPPDVVA